MTYAITKYTKQQIATLATDQLAHAVALYTEKLRSDCAKAYNATVLAKTPAEKKTAIILMEQANKRLDEYIEEQKAMFESRGQDKNRAWKYAIIPTGEFTKGGTEVMRIVEREVNIAPFDMSVDEPLNSDTAEMNRAPEWESDEDWEAIDDVSRAWED